MPLSCDFTIRSGRELGASRIFSMLFSKKGWIALSSGAETGKSVPRGDINATIGFQDLHMLADKPAKCQIRMLGPKRNPPGPNLSAIISCRRERKGVHLKVQAVCQARDICCLFHFPGTVAEHVMESIPEESST